MLCLRHEHSSRSKGLKKVQRRQIPRCYDNKLLHEYSNTQMPLLRSVESPSLIAPPKIIPLTIPLAVSLRALQVPD